MNENTQQINAQPSLDVEMDKLKHLVNEALKQAKQLGASDAEVGAHLQSGLATMVRLKEVDTVSFHRDKGFGITVYFGQRKGNASTSDTTPESISQTVAAACQIAKHTAEDNCAGLADKADMATDIRDLDLYHPWLLDAEQAVELATSCETSGLAFSQDITNSEGASVNTTQGVSVYGNSHGFIEGYPKSRHSVSCVLIGERDGQKQRDYWYTVARSAENLSSAQSVGKKAAERTQARLGARKIATTRVPVIFAAPVAAGLFGSFLSAISGGQLYRKASFLCDHLHEQVFAEHIHLHEDPFQLQGLASAPFDDEGVATCKRDIVTNGILQSYILSSYSARRLGLKTTGNAGGVHNLMVKPGEHDFSGLLKAMDKGLLITELMGQGVNLLTGDYSRGATGFWVEQGEIQYPVEEITVAGNLRDMFKNIIAVGQDVDKRSAIITGSVLIEQMMIAGV